MTPSPLRNMPPLVAAATEHRINGAGTMDPKINESKDRRCSLVRLRCDLIVRYRIRAVGDAAPSGRHLHHEAPRSVERSFHLHDPDNTFFRSYSTCRDTIHWMLKETAGNDDEFDFAADNWDHFLPHDLATTNVAIFRRETQKRGGVVALRFNLDMDITIWVDVVYDEPKALLLACVRWEALEARCGGRCTAPAECCVCMEGLAAEEEEEEDSLTVRLPCSHAFHRDCIAPWFYKVPTCPMCRHDMSKYLVAFTNTARGNFPGLPS